MSTSSLSRWGTTALVVVLLGGFVTWLALPWIKSDPPENAGVVYLPTPENLPRNADAWYMLLREAEMPEDWHEQVVPTDDTTAIRTCRGTLNDGRAGFASTDWGSFTASQPVEMSESILIFLSDPDAERYVRNVPNVTACEAQLFDTSCHDDLRFRDFCSDALVRRERERRQASCIR
jgi:hypothetical protein